MCLIFFFLNLFSIVANASNNEFDKGAIYFAQGDYLSALSLWAPIAKQGHPTALYSIGLLYDQGKGVQKDSKRAIKYLQSASDKNLPVAQYYLGMKYYAGLNVKKNTTKARQLLEKAAQGDYLQAQFHLANLYDKGEGGHQDIKMATYWFTQSAENGFGPGQHSLAVRYLTGKGITMNLERGIFWLKKAADQHDLDAMRDLGFMYFQGIGVKKDFQQAHDLLLIPAEENNRTSLFLLGEIYYIGGNGITQDIPKAKKWYQRAKKAGHNDATKRLQQLDKNTIVSTKDKTIQQTFKRAQPSSQIEPSIQTSTDNRLIQDAIRFKQLDETYYLLQIVAAKKFDNINQLTNKYADEFTFFLKIKKGEEHFFILTYGYYPSYNEAQNDIKNLPKVFQQKSKPWIRQIKHLKNSIL